MALTKEHIAQKIIELGYSKREATKIIESLFEIIKRSLESGEDVLVSRFGKFAVKKKSPRRGRNPQTGEDLMLGARNAVTFKCSGLLRDRMNGNPIR